jgi:hypothetical protein
VSRLGRRSIGSIALSLTLTVWLMAAPDTSASGEVVLTVSPLAPTVGEPVEILLRTFVPVEQADWTIGLPTSPERSFPAASGVWDVLYPWPDYPFDVVAQHNDSPDIPVRLSRDNADATLWRGEVTFPASGSWTIWVRNYVCDHPGATATVTVRTGTAADLNTPSEGVASRRPMEACQPNPVPTIPTGTGLPDSRLILDIVLAVGVVGLSILLFRARSRRGRAG